MQEKTTMALVQMPDLETVDDGQLGPGLVELPDIETLVLLQATVDRVGLVALRSGPGKMEVK